MLPVIGRAIFSLLTYSMTGKIVEPLRLFLVLTDHFRLTALLRENLSTPTHNSYLCITEQPSSWCQKNRAITLS